MSRDEWGRYRHSVCLQGPQCLTVSFAFELLTILKLPLPFSVSKQLCIMQSFVLTSLNRILQTRRATLSYVPNRITNHDAQVSIISLMIQVVDCYISTGGVYVRACAFAHFVSSVMEWRPGWDDPISKWGTRSGRFLVSQLSLNRKRIDKLCKGRREFVTFLFHCI